MWRTIRNWAIGLSIVGLLGYSFVIGIKREGEEARARTNDTVYGIECHRIGENEFVLIPWKEFRGHREERYVSENAELETALNDQLKLNKKIVWNDRYKGSEGVRVLTTDR